MWCTYFFLRVAEVNNYHISRHYAIGEFLGIVAATKVVLSRVQVVCFLKIKSKTKRLSFIYSQLLLFISKPYTPT